MMKKLLSFIFATLCLPGWMCATEYFVSPDGDDTRDGRSLETAFATIQHGVDQLVPGDILTLAPGEYFESVHRENLGGENVDTVIRAAIPGTAVLRGDVDAPPFEPVEGYRFVYSAPFSQEVQAVNEVDTLRIMESAPDLVRLEQVPGGFVYDADAQRLYISSTDLRSPTEHRYTVSVADGRGGLFFQHPTRVVVEGLVFTGYHANERFDRLRGGLSGADAIPHGIYLWEANQCVIRDGAAYLNSAGFTVYAGADNTIENCEAHANRSRYSTESGNINFFQPENVVARNNKTSRGQHGLRLYGSGDEVSGGLIENNLSWDNQGAQFQVKAGRRASEESLLTRSVALGGGVSVANVAHSVLEESGRREDNAVENIMLDHFPDLDWEAEFADPVNMDFRLQSTSRFRNAGADGADLGPYPYEANVYYVSEQGDDGADGLSVAGAWTSLDHALASIGAGDTLYVLPGTYEVGRAFQVPDGDAGPVRLAGRGTGAVTIKGALEIERAGDLVVERLRFSGPTTLRGGGNTDFSNVIFDEGLTAEGSGGLRLEHGVLSGGAEVPLVVSGGMEVFLAGNVFRNAEGPALVLEDGARILYSGYNGFEDVGRILVTGDGAFNLEALQAEGSELQSIDLADLALDGEAVSLAGYGPPGTALGIHHRFVEETVPQRLVGPFVHSTTDTTANIEWWTSAPTLVHIAWGKKGAEHETTTIQAHRFGSFSVTGLEPDSDYEFVFRLDGPFESSSDDRETWEWVETAELIARTATQPHEAAEYYVSVNGDNARDGLSLETAWRTLNHAADRVRPGDTVYVAEGVYHESVRIRATGEEGRPITFTVVPGHRVELNGDGRLIDHAFSLENKRHLHFDGFYLRDFAMRSTTVPWADSGVWHNSVFVLYRSGDLEIRRCFHDGRGAGYGPGILIAVNVDGLTVRNSVICDSMGGGISIYGSPDVRIENNVFLRNKIQHLSEVVNEPDQPIYVERNIFTDNLAGKVGGAMFAVGTVESFHEDTNCYFFRIPGEERNAFMFYGVEAYGRPAELWGMRVELPSPKVTELTRMTFYEFQEVFNPETGSLVADPGFAGAAAFEGDEGRTGYVVDRLMGNRDLDFHDLFATNPDVVELGIGLQPGAFADFEFEAAE